MKKSLLLLCFLAFFTACSDDSETQSVGDDNQLPVGNKVVLLKVDLLTNTFEGGKELAFPENDAFTLIYDYNPPGDFGDITLIYEEVSEPIFAGGIVWAGMGEMTYPESIDAPETFSTINGTVTQPAESQFESYFNEEFNFYYDNIDYNGIWSSVSNLAVVKEYRESNPDSKVNLYLYTPSVGVGDPADWDWFVILKN
ncbi:hypothetical protein ABS768_12270 [Flavobacterium sp. ST-75]|uniref:DUF5017 domain-containing protein n=1 Tax=Flavobacterium rhizophilum TaxID=3163296 RepID=A0ABW8YDH4_9FLAO